MSFKTKRFWRQLTFLFVVVGMGFLLITSLTTRTKSKNKVYEGELAPSKLKMVTKRVTPESSEDSQNKDVLPQDLSKEKGTVKSSDLDSPMARFVKMESLRVGTPDENPKQSFKRLKSVASGLNNNDVENLKNISLDRKYNNEQRFLSVYLLALAENPQVAGALMSVALDPLETKDKSSPTYAEELMIRTQALEGIAKVDPRGRKSRLAEFLKKQDNAFLAEQAKRLIREKH
ncbi:MAG: hypothetical protein K1X29_03510 [Bdellovibrionales bacterium]|nr:hypothetical protein [Bdellovibrionales bacterium]